MRKARLIAVVAAAALALAACSGDDETTTTTNAAGDGTTAPTGSGSTTTSAPEASETTIRGQIVTEYETVARVPTDNGEVLHVVLPEGAYTDIDLFNFLADLKEANPALWGVEVFDSAEAAAAFQVESSQRTEEQEQLLRRHHLASLVSGDTVRYQGPFSEFGQQVLGS